MRFVRCFIPGMLFAAALVAAEPIELKEQPYDIVPMLDGRTLEGTLLEQRTDGTVVFKLRDATSEMVIPANDHGPVRFRRSAAQVVTAAGAQAIAAKDQRRLIEVLRWGGEVGAAQACVAQAVAWLKQSPADRDVLAAAVPAFKAAQDWTGLESVARAALAADRMWNDGDELIIDALTAQKRIADRDAYARDWLGRNPTALRANVLCAAVFEAAGDMRQARECFKKTWVIHKKTVGALGLARTSLSTGQYAEGLQAAQSLLPCGQPDIEAEAKAYAGGLAAALGDIDTAKQLLTGFEPAGLPGPAAQAGSYALGLIAYRQGRMGEAAKQWKQVSTLPAQLALATAQRREFASVDRLPNEYRPAARLLNACVLLENQQTEKALALIDQHLDGRHAFLYKIAAMLRSNGAPDAVRALGVVGSPESRRWQLYGHIIAGRLADAEQLARSFPPDDGYAMACRVFIAAARGDPEGARNLFEGSGGLPGAPAEYARRLAELYSTADDTVLVEPFDWPTGEAMPTGWEASIPGTGIAVRADAGHLVMEGTQSAQATDPVTRASTLVPGERFRLARLTVDIAAAAQATVGLELLDGARRNGVAIATRPNQANLHWRELEKGTWTAWQPLPYAVSGTTAVIALDVSGGRIFAADPADPVSRTQLSAALARAQGDWSLSVFGSADPGVAWRAAFDDLRWRLKPVK